MDAVYLQIAGTISECPAYLLKRNELIKLASLSFCDASIDKPTKLKARVQVDGIFLHHLLNEFLCSSCYRNQFIEQFNRRTNKANVILFVLIPPEKDIIDHKWNYRITYLVRECCELEHALSWLSTLGGACSALGDYFINFAEVAARISYHQLLLAIRMDDPNVEARCKLYFSLSLIQRRRFKSARKIIEKVFRAARSAVIVDTRLVNMCFGIWSKLQYEHKMNKLRSDLRERGNACDILL